MWSIHRKSFNIALWILLFFAFSTKPRTRVNFNVWLCVHLYKWMNERCTHISEIYSPPFCKSCSSSLSPFMKFPPDASFIRAERQKKTDSFGKFSLYCYCLCIKHRLLAADVMSWILLSPASDRVVEQWGMLKYIEIFSCLCR